MPFLILICGKGVLMSDLLSSVCLGAGFGDSGHLDHAFFPVSNLCSTNIMDTHGLEGNVNVLFS